MVDAKYVAALPADKSPPACVVCAWGDPAYSTAPFRRDKVLFRRTPRSAEDLPEPFKLPPTPTA